MTQGPYERSEIVAFDNQGINQRQIKRLEVSKRIERTTKFILPLYNIFYPIMYFIVCLHN